MKKVLFVAATALGDFCFNGQDGTKIHVALNGQNLKITAAANAQWVGVGFPAPPFNSMGHGNFVIGTGGTVFDKSKTTDGNGAPNQDVRQVVPGTGACSTTGGTTTIDFQRQLKPPNGLNTIDATKPFTLFWAHGTVNGNAQGFSKILYHGSTRGMTQIDLTHGNCASGNSTISNSTNGTSSNTMNNSSGMSKNNSSNSMFPAVLSSGPSSSSSGQNSSSMSNSSSTSSSSSSNNMTSQQQQQQRQPNQQFGGSGSSGNSSQNTSQQQQQQQLMAQQQQQQQQQNSQQQQQQNNSNSQQQQNNTQQQQQNNRGKGGFVVPLPGSSSSGNGMNNTNASTQQQNNLTQQQQQQQNQQQNNSMNNSTSQQSSGLTTGLMMPSGSQKFTSAAKLGKKGKALCKAGGKIICTQVVQKKMGKCVLGSCLEVPIPCGAQGTQSCNVDLQHMGVNCILGLCVNTTVMRADLMTQGPGSNAFQQTQNQNQNQNQNSNQNRNQIQNQNQNQRNQQPANNQMYQGTATSQGSSTQGSTTLNSGWTTVAESGAHP